MLDKPELNCEVKQHRALYVPCLQVFCSISFNNNGALSAERKFQSVNKCTFTFCLFIFSLRWEQLPTQQMYMLTRALPDDIYSITFNNNGASCPKR